MQKFDQLQKTEVGFPSESGGLMADPADWDDQTDYATMFGQGFSTTAVQVPALYQTIANGGVGCRCSSSRGAATRTAR